MTITGNALDFKGRGKDPWQDSLYSRQTLPLNSLDQAPEKFPLKIKLIKVIFCKVQVHYLGGLVLLTGILPIWLVWSIIIKIHDFIAVSWNNGLPSLSITLIRCYIIMVWVWLITCPVSLCVLPLWPFLAVIRLCLPVLVCSIRLDKGSYQLCLDPYIYMA